MAACLSRVEEAVQGTAHLLWPVQVGCALDQARGHPFHRGGFVTLRQRCNHERKWHTDPKGLQAFSAHPTTWGSRTAGVWKTNAAAQYSPLLCRELARCIAVVQPVAASDEPWARPEIPATGS